MSQELKVPILVAKTLLFQNGAQSETLMFASDLISNRKREKNNSLVLFAKEKAKENALSCLTNIFKNFIVFAEYEEWKRKGGKVWI